MDSPARLNPRSVPVFTLLLCGAALIVFAFPALQHALIYDRAAISSGEWWRLVSGHLVHYSLSHLLFDVLAVFVTGAFIEIRRYRGFEWLCFLTATAIGIVLYLGAPRMAYYGGLSGIATASAVFLCLNGLHETRPWRHLCGVALILLTGKISVELTFGTSLMMYFGSQPFVPMPISHAVGAASAVLTYYRFRDWPGRLTVLPLKR